MTDTVKYWMEQARSALNKAEEIAENTNEEISFDLGNVEFTYLPANSRLTKSDALDLLSSGRELTEAEKAGIRKAIEEETILDDDWYSSATGWVTSSDLC